MPFRKSLKTLFMETVMFVSLFALFSHVAVNFWERYVIQKELVLMKCSLHALKGTINNIGLAYDHLEDELKTLVVFAANPDASKRKLLEKKMIFYPEHTTPTFLDSYMQSSFEENEKDINEKPSTRNKSGQIYSLLEMIPKVHKNATTLITPLLRNVNTQKCNHVHANKNKVDRYVDLAFPLEDKQIQYTSRNYHKSFPGKDAATRTTYPLKATGTAAKSKYSIHNPKVRSGCANRSGRLCSSPYHEKCYPDCYKQ